MEAKPALAISEQRALNELETALQANGSLKQGQSIPIFQDKADLDSSNIGVYVEQDTVGALAIRFCELGDLPTSIGQLSNLQYLDSAGNRLTSLPDSIGKLARLKKLYLDKNRLASLPSTIGNLLALEE